MDFSCKLDTVKERIDELKVVWRKYPEWKTNKQRKKNTYERIINTRLKWDGLTFGISEEEKRYMK